MSIRRAALAAIFAIPLVLTACGNGNQDTTPTTTSSATSTSAATSAASSTTSRTTEEPEPAIEEQAVAEQVPAPETPVAEPYVLYCSEGTPGPAMWSDGQMRFSQECFDVLTAGRGDYQCPQTDHFVHDPSECGTPQPYPGNESGVDWQDKNTDSDWTDDEVAAYTACLERYDYSPEASVC